MTVCEYSLAYVLLHFLAAVFGFILYILKSSYNPGHFSNIICPSFRCSPVSPDNLSLKLMQELKHFCYQSQVNTYLHRWKITLEGWFHGLAREHCLYPPSASGVPERAAAASGKKHTNREETSEKSSGQPLAERIRAVRV